MTLWSMARPACATKKPLKDLVRVEAENIIIEVCTDLTSAKETQKFQSFAFLINVILPGVMDRPTVCGAC